MNDAESIKRKASKILLQGFGTQEAELGEMVELIYLTAALACHEQDPSDWLPGIPIVCVEWPEDPVRLILTLPDGNSLAAALEGLCRIIGGTVAYHHNGIIVYPPLLGPVAQPPAPELPAATEVEQQVLRETWQQQKAEILRLYPQVGQPGSTASQTFLRAFQRAGSDPRRALQVAKAIFGEPAAAAPCPPSTPPPPEPQGRMVTFIGGPADGLQVMVQDLPGTAYITPVGYKNVWYTVADGQNVSRFVKWVRLEE